MIKSLFLLTVFFFVFSTGSLFSQNPHLNGGDGSSPIGGGSLIGGGLVILTALGIGYVYPEFTE